MKWSGKAKLLDFADIPISILLGVTVCLIGTQFTLRGRLFCIIAYIPIATVRAAIDSVPLSLGDFPAAVLFFPLLYSVF